MEEFQKNNLVYQANVKKVDASFISEEAPIEFLEFLEKEAQNQGLDFHISSVKEASDKKQIIVTTHNPEIVRHAGLENLLLVSRDKEGFSTISRPSEKEEVRTFLIDEIGIEELYIRNLLGM